MSEHAESAHDPLANNCGVPWYGDPVGLLTPESIALYIVARIWLLYGIKVVSEDYFAERCVCECVCFLARARVCVCVCV